VIATQRPLAAPANILEGKSKVCIQSEAAVDIRSASMQRSSPLAYLDRTTLQRVQVSPGQL
jgi:hypothetical protein